MFICPAGVPGHLAAPLSHGGLQKVADQGPQPGSVAEARKLQQEQEVLVDVVYMRAGEYVRMSLRACVNPQRTWLIPPARKPITSVIPAKMSCI